MKYIKIDLNTKFTLENISIALGNFDGFHIGHKELIFELEKIKKEKNLKTAVLLFRKHSKDFIQKKDYKRLTSFDDKLQILQIMNVDYVFAIDFDEQLKNLSALEFLEFLTKNINVKYIVVGEDYKFSKNQEGSSKLILNYMKNKNLDCSILKDIKYNHLKISSSDIIKFISLGEIEKANRFLGRYYSVKGIVKKGYRRGTSMGFPTANLDLLFNYVIPKDGVYFTKTRYNNKEYFSFSSIGNNPTFENKESTIETHIFNFNENIYGEKIEVFFIKKIRNNIKFDSVNSLIKQLEKDKKICKNLIDNLNMEEI